MTPEILSVLALLVSLINVVFNLTKFKKEKKWDQKSQAYTHFIESLYELQTKTVKNLKLLEKGDASEDEQLSLYFIQIKKYGTLGSFYLSPSFLTQVNYLICNLERIENESLSYCEYLERKRPSNCI